MALPRVRDEESAASGGEDSPTSKKARSDARFPLSRCELAAAIAVFVTFIVGILSIFSTMPREEYEKILRLPRSLSDLRLLKDNIAVYATDYQVNFMLGYCSVYIFMQTFMIPGTIFMSLLAGALFGVGKGLVLVVFTATAGASSCYFLSKIIGRPLVSWLWPEKLRFFQAEIAKRKEKLLNYMLFLRITPTLPNTFISSQNSNPKSQISSSSELLLLLLLLFATAIDRRRGNHWQLRKSALSSLSAASFPLHNWRSDPQPRTEKPLFHFSYPAVNLARKFLKIRRPSRISAKRLTL